MFGNQKREQNFIAKSSSSKHLYLGNMCVAVPFKLQLLFRETTLHVYVHFRNG